MIGSRLHALVVGVDRYSYPDELSPGLYLDLVGAVLDARRWVDFLRERGVSNQRLCLLTAPLEGGPGPNLPTYDRFRKALKELEDRTCPGDEVLFIFSGHGGRVPTSLPDLKGEDGIDEALILSRDDKTETRVLRDVELAVILQRWVERNLRITLCFDCCHAGGTARRSGVRGTGLLDTNPWPSASGIAGSDELSEVWRTVTRRRRDLEPASGWLPNPRGYVLFAACQAHERAYEGCFDTLGPGGAMTHALLQALRSAPPDVTCAQLHQQVLCKVQGWTEVQTPQVEGERERTFWNVETPHQEAVTEAGGEVLALLGQGDPGHYLMDLLSLAAYRVPIDFDPQQGTVTALRWFVEGRVPDQAPFRDGEWICLRVKNRSKQPLFVALYARLPDGGRKRVYPMAGVGEAELLHPGGWDLLPLRPRLTGGACKTTERVEAIAANSSRLFEGNVGSEVFWTVVALDLPVVAL